MTHLFINHHFFYGQSRLGQALKGPSPDIVRRQMGNSKSRWRNARGVWDALTTDERVFSITIDDGSRSILDVLPIFVEEGVHVSLCICAISTMHIGILLIHRINLLRAELGDSELWNRLCESFDTTFPIREWPLHGTVLQDSLYRYDELVTRWLKIALNYQLSYEQTSDFIIPLFGHHMGSDDEMSRRLYLGVDELQDLSSDIDIMFHGREHRLWAELDDRVHETELAPPGPLEGIISANYVLSVPFGMEGSYDAVRVIRDAGQAVGAFVLARNVKHQCTDDGFWWLSRYDQADIFDGNGEFRGRQIPASMV